MKGFSLVEIMVVIGVTILLSTLVLSYNRTSETQLVMFRDQATIVATLNRAKSLAVERFNDPESLACAFGVHFEHKEGDPDEFVLFQDEDINCAVTNYTYDTGEDLETHELDPRLSFSGLIGSNVDVLFIPPELQATSTALFPVRITIQASDGDQVVIEISASSQITTLE